MAAPRLSLQKAEVIEHTGTVITTKEGNRALIMPRPSTMAHGFVFLAPMEFDETVFWMQFAVDLTSEPFNMVTGFGDDTYRPATSDETVLEIARQYSEAKDRAIQPPPQQIDLSAPRIKLK